MGDVSPKPIDDDESICRFVFSTQDRQRDPLRAKPEAFLPGRDGETSVSRVYGLDESAILELGKLARGTRAESLKGYAILTASEVPRADLRLRVDEPPLRHAVIYGWPEDKSKRILAAIDLAQASTMRLVA